MAKILPNDENYMHRLKKLSKAQAQEIWRKLHQNML